MMPNIVKGLIAVGVIVAAAGVAWGLVLTGPEPALTEPEERTISIRVLTVQPREVTLKVRSQGNVIPSIEGELIPEVTGRVEWMSPNLVSGGFFEKDEVLLKIDSRDYRSNVDRAKAAVARTRAEDEHARFELKRLQELVKKRLTSQSQLEAGLRVQRIAAATLKDAEISLVQAQRDLWRTEIRAPFTGLVRSEKVDLGQFVSRGQTMASIYATDEVEVRLPMADSQLAFLDLPLGHRGKLPDELSPKVSLSTLYGGKEYTWYGRLVRTEADIDSKSRMVQAIVRVQNKVEEGEVPLPVGLFVQAEIEGRSVQDVIALPRAALRNRNQVLVVDRDSRLRYRTVELLRFDRDQVLIRAGLKAGELVNISPIQTVVDGMRVKAINVSPATASAGAG